MLGITVPCSNAELWDFPFKNWANQILHISKIQLVVYYQCRVLIGWATSRLFVIVH